MGGGGVSGATKLFIEKRYGHVLRGEGGQRAMSKVVFCKKVCFGVPEELLCVKIIYILHASKHELQYQPSGAGGTRSLPATPNCLLHPKWNADACANIRQSPHF